MGRNDEYSRDAYFEYDGVKPDTNNQEDEEIDLTIDPEDWQALYSDELLNAWMTIREYFENMYIWTSVTYNDFTTFVTEPHVFWSHDPPTARQHEIWEALKVRSPFVKARVAEEQFYGWSNNYIEFH